MHIDEQDCQWSSPWNNSKKRHNVYRMWLYSFNVNRVYIVLVWHPHIVYIIIMNHGYYGVFNKYITLVSLVIRKLPMINPSPFGLGVYQRKTSSDLRLTSYICWIHLLVVVYILYICVCVIYKPQLVGVFQKYIQPKSEFRESSPLGWGI